MIFNKSKETMSRDEITQVQLERLQMTLNRVYRNVAFYKTSFDTQGVGAESIRTLEDLGRLPFTTREHLLSAYPYDMFAVPLRDIVRLHSTSGTAGKPVVVGYTKNDLSHWAECTARLLSAAGITDQDVVQIAFHYDLCTGGFGFHQGAERIGASVIPASATAPDKQIMVMRDYKTTALLSTPSFAARLAQELETQHIHPEKLFLKKGLFGAEPWSENLRREIEERLHITALDNYGLTEIMGPGVAGECEEKRGLHVNEDHFIVEIVDPATGAAVSAGETGELVFTTITKEGFPLIRYRSGDMAAFLCDPCPCGRTFCRISRVSGRTDDLIFFGGTKLFPADVEKILLAVEGTAPHFAIDLWSDPDGSEVMEVKVEISEKVFAIDKLRDLESVRDVIRRRIEQVLGVSAKVLLVEPKSLRTDADGAKFRRVTDRRRK
ncbi:MAG: phenylacetate--CoA ligase [Spirochaetales bacterium]|nr:phenylacetate--CoA ligase [Spirochaetales bacterium]